MEHPLEVEPTVTYQLKQLAAHEIDALRAMPEAVFDDRAKTVTFPNPALKDAQEVKQQMAEAVVAEEDIPPVPSRLKEKLEKSFRKDKQVEESGEVPQNQDKPGALPEIKQIQITEEIRRAFLRSLLGGSRFKYTIKFSDKLSATYQERNGAQDEDAIYRAIGAGTARMPLEITYGQLAYTLREIEMGDSIREFPEIQPKQKGEGTDAYAIDLRIEEIKQLAQALIAKLSRARTQFDDLIARLYKEMEDPKS